MVKSVGKFLILIIEDDSDDRLLLEEALESYVEQNDLEFNFYDDIDEIMTYLRSCKPDRAHPATWPGLIITDIKLPKADGLEILRQLKDDDHLRLIPVVVMSDSPSKKHVEASYELGASGFIQKPAYFKDLADTIKDIVDYWKIASRVPTRPD